MTGVIAATVGQRATALQVANRANSFSYVHLDVFTTRRFEGNQLLVFTQATDLDTEAMQAMTKESNYSENTFVLSPEQAGTGGQEVDCGSTFLIVPLATRQAVDAAAIDRPKLDAVCQVAGDRAQSILLLQGVKVGRPSRLHVRIGGSRSEITSVQVGGASVVVGEGTTIANREG